MYVMNLLVEELKCQASKKQELDTKPYNKFNEKDKKKNICKQI
jgi:hypothetical protein